MPRGSRSARLNHLNPVSRLSRRHRIAAVVAPLATVAVVGAGVAVTQVAPAAQHGALASSLSQAAQAKKAGPATTAAAARSLSSSALTGATRSASVSRDLDRLALPKVTGHQWTTEDLDLRFAPAEDARTAGTIEAMKKIAVSDVTHGDYAQVVVDHKPFWVTKKYLADKKPSTPESMGISNAPCPDGSGIESALQPDSIRVYRAVCAAFPQLTTYGGQDGHGEHVNGEAIDFMIPDPATGEAIKQYLYAHHDELHIFDIIYAQHIWTIQRASEGFRSMSDRGSATANHYDHVHMKIIG